MAGPVKTGSAFFVLDRRVRLRCACHHRHSL